MFISYDKTRNRAFAYKISCIFVFVVGVSAVVCTAYTLIFYIKMGTVIISLLLWAETICTIMTFYESVCAGPNSALLNLPLLAVDLMFAVLYSNTICLLFDTFALIDRGKDPDVWQFDFSDFLRSVIFLIVIARYAGLAWTDQNFYLKRIFSPIRVDKVKEFAPASSQGQNPQFMMSDPIPMPI